MERLASLEETLTEVVVMESGEKVILVSATLGML